MTPLEYAVINGKSDTVYYFINNLKMDIKQFDEVILKIVLCLYICLVFY